MDGDPVPARVTIAAVQMAPRIGDPAANRAAIEDRARDAAARGADLVVFPECALTGYSFDVPGEPLALAEAIPGPATGALARVARDLRIHLLLGMLEREGDRFYNSLVLLGPGGLVGESYRKIHLPGLGLDRFAAPGDRPFPVHDTPLGRIGLNICYDAGFPESSRVLALRGADIIALPTNWPAGAEALAEHLPIARALENHVYYVAANRVGEERGCSFIGRSSIVDPLGAVLARASADREETILADAEPAAAREKRVVRRGGAYVVDRIADRRPEFYGPIAERPRGGSD